MKLKHFHQIWAALALCCLATLACAAPDYRVQIDAPAGLSELLNQHLPLMTDQQDPDLDAAGVDAMLRATPDTVRQIMETEGYFSPQIRVWTQTGARPVYHVEVKPGEPVTIARVDLQLDGAIRDEPDFAGRFAAIEKKWPLPVGKVFRQADWDSGKREAQQQLAVDRFPLAKITDSRIDIDPETRQARIRVTLDSGPRIRFGALKIRGLNRYPQALVDNLANFHQGDPYNQQKLQEFQSALEQQAQFAGALVGADPQRIADGEVPVDVDVTEQPTKKLDLGLTYDSDFGPGTRFGYDHYNVFGSGWTGSSVLSWNNSEQNLGLGLSMPRTAGGYVNSLTVSWDKTNIQGLITDSRNIGVWHTRAEERHELRFGMEYLIDNEHTNGSADQTNHALMPSVGWTWRGVDDLLRPRSGFMLDGTLGSTPGELLSSTRFTRAYGRGVGYWTPGNPAWGTWMARLELGQIWAADSTQVPVSQLFRAGGVNSVRGYDYESLGVPGPAGAVLGGTVLATATLEYQIPVARDWSVALFRDAGDAAQGWNSYNLHHSYGIGARWFSPVAPFSLDLAKDPHVGGIKLHMSLGLAF